MQMTETSQPPEASVLNQKPVSSPYWAIAGSVVTVLIFVLDIIAGRFSSNEAIFGLTSSFALHFWLNVLVLILSVIAIRQKSLIWLAIINILIAGRFLLLILLLPFVLFH